MRGRRGGAFDELVLRRVRRLLDRIADRHLRHAAGYDDPVGAGDSSRSLSESLAGNGGDHPLSLMIAAEDALTPEAREAEAKLDRVERPDDSPAGAWALLMRRFDNSTRAVAYFLRVSTSHARQCRARVAAMAKRQNAIVFSQLGADAKLGLWRRCHYERTQVQLKLDFGESLV